MALLNFELPSALATTLRNEAQNDQNRIGEIVDFALLKHLGMDSHTMTSAQDLSLTSLRPYWHG